VERVIEHDHGWPAAEAASDLDGVLHRLRSAVHQEGPLLVITRGDLIEGLAQLDVRLVWVDQKAGVREPFQSPGCAGDDSFGAVADTCHGDSTAEVDERVSVCVDHHAATRGRHEHRQYGTHSSGHGRTLAGQEIL
jgi:hypothetical protein